MKIIEVIADAGHHDTIASIAEQQQVEDIWFGANNEDGRIFARLLVSPENRQSILDTLHTILQTSDNYRILIIPLDTSLPKSVETDNDNPEAPSEEKARKKAALMSSREEILTQVEKDTNRIKNLKSITRTMQMNSHLRVA